MNFEYQTSRLILKIIKPAKVHASQVLDFYNKNRTTFERYEAARPENFYTTDYQYSILTCEYNLALQLKTIRFWVYEKSNPTQMIGTICFYNIMHSIYERCEVGYKFDQAYWHKGYALEAMQMGMFVMLEDLQLHRIEALVMKENTPSVRLLKNLGFEYEGVCRKVVRIQDDWEDHLLFSYIK